MLTWDLDFFLTFLLKLVTCLEQWGYCKYTAVWIFKVTIAMWPAFRWRQGTLPASHNISFWSAPSPTCQEDPLPDFWCSGGIAYVLFGMKRSILFKYWFDYDLPILWSMVLILLTVWCFVVWMHRKTWFFSATATSTVWRIKRMMWSQEELMAFS